MPDIIPLLSNIPKDHFVQLQICISVMDRGELFIAVAVPAHLSPPRACPPLHRVLCPRFSSPCSHTSLCFSASHRCVTVTKTSLRTESRLATASSIKPWLYHRKAKVKQIRQGRLLSWRKGCPSRSRHDKAAGRADKCRQRRSDELQCWGLANSLQTLRYRAASLQNPFLPRGERWCGRCRALGRALGVPWMIYGQNSVRSGRTQDPNNFLLRNVLKWFGSRHIIYRTYSVR